MPIASTRPNIESVFTEKPSTGKKMNVPTREIGIVIRERKIVKEIARLFNADWRQT